MRPTKRIFLVLALVGIAMCLSAYLLPPVFSPRNNASTTTTTTTTTTPPPSPLALVFLSAAINGCSQVANVNATWTGAGYYSVDPSNFHLIIKTPNAVYSNTTDVIQPNNTVSWYLFQNVPITLRLSFFSCTPVASEHLVYTDGQFSITIA